MESPGGWLEGALANLCNKTETGLDLDGDLISSLVSFCELASPADARNYLSDIIGVEVGEDVINEYVKRRDQPNPVHGFPDRAASSLQAYVKPPITEIPGNRLKKPLRTKLEETAPHNSSLGKYKQEGSERNNSQKVNQSKPRKNKTVSLEEAIRGSVVYHQGKPCSCQARQHRLVSNCLSCGKIVCEQEGEGPCSFCGALVLKEGSAYARLHETETGTSLPLSDTEAGAAAEAYAKRLVDYDRNSAARTAVIDDQSDYYNIEGSSWLSMEEKEQLQKKQKEMEEEEEARRRKMVVTFDLFGRKVLIGNEEARGEGMAVPPNPNVTTQPIFVGQNPKIKSTGIVGSNSRSKMDICVEITGRVQHDPNEECIL